MRTSSRPAVALGGVAMLTALGLLGGTGAAEAAPSHGSTTSTTSDTQPVQIQDYSLGVAIMHTSTHTVSMSATADVDSSQVATWQITSANLYRGSTKVGTIGAQQMASGSDTSEPVTFTIQNSWGRGTFALRDVQLEVTKIDHTVLDYTDTTVGAYAVASGVDGNIAFDGAKAALVFSHHGRKHVFKVGLRRYTTTGWSPYAGHWVKIQEYTAGHWKTVKSLKLNTYGRASWTRYTGSKYSYRMYSAPSGWTVGAKTNPTPKI